MLILGRHLGQHTDVFTTIAVLISSAVYYMIILEHFLGGLTHFFVSLSVIRSNRLIPVDDVRANIVW